MIGTKPIKLIVDPPKLNRGQVVQSKTLNSFISGTESISYTASKPCKSDAQKKTVKNVICVDWFEVTISMENEDFLMLHDDVIDVKLSECVYLKRQGGSAGYYDRKWEVIYMGESFGVLLTNPKVNYMETNQAQFKVNNESLYRTDWLDNVKEIMSECLWNYKSTTRFDIAIDGQAGLIAEDITIKHLKGKKTRRGKIERKGRANFKVEFNQNREIMRYHVGSSSSEKNATIYRKKDEIQKSGKQYIQDVWKANGLEITDSLRRFELRMKSKVMKSYEWERLDDMDYIASILRTETKNWFEFYYMKNDTNKHRSSKSQPIEWIDWESIKGELLPKSRAVSKTSIYRAKRLIKDTLYYQHVEGRKVDTKIIGHLINEFCLDKWYDARIDSWLAEFERERKYKNSNNN